MTEEERVREPGQDGVPDTRARCSPTSSTSCPRPPRGSRSSRRASTASSPWDLKEAQVVLNDAVLGLQLFNAGRRPFELDRLPSGVLNRGTGIHTEPTLVDEADDLDAIARLCEVALRLDRLHYESLHDPLTGLYNRRGFDDHLGASISRSVRYGWSFGLVLLDLDGFKAINDRIGHQGGDAVLRQVGEDLRHGLRAGDIAARVGGDEFALLLHIDGPNSIEAILDRLHGHQGGGADITWTAGLAMCPDEASSVDDLYRFADQRLYEAKHASQATKRNAESTSRT